MDDINIYAKSKVELKNVLIPNQLRLVFNFFRLYATCFLPDST